MIRMKRGNSVKDVVNYDLIPELEKQGWEALDRKPTVSNKNKIKATAEVVEPEGEEPEAVEDNITDKGE
jgi:hypothetical protein